jgi:aspartate kinase
MNIIVQKYGGTSVENKEKLENICSRIISYIKRNQKLIVVVSAQGKYTDKLIEYAKVYSNEPNKRDLDILLSTGELQSVSLLCMMLHDKGINCIGLSGEQAGIISTSNHGNAKIDYIYTESLKQYLNEYDVIVVARISSCR